MKHNIIEKGILIISSVITGMIIMLSIVYFGKFDFSDKTKEKPIVINNDGTYLTYDRELKKGFNSFFNREKNENKKEDKNNLDFISIETFGNPLSDRYMSRISSPQGIRDEIELDNGGTAGKYYHNAIDVAVPEGTSVYATKSGKVMNVYPSYYNGGALYKGHPTYGGLIEIAHNDGTKTLYAHLSLTLVKEGDVVNKGDKIGQSGGVVGKRGSGLSTGPHLHYSIILDMNTFVTKK